MIFGINDIPIFITKIYTIKRLFPEFDFLGDVEMDYYDSMILNKEGDSFIL
jgi:hypothetical protein